MLQRKRDHSSESRTFAKAFVYLIRALRLKCPVCGRCSMFVPAVKIKSLYDWYTPLDGCHRCGYPYTREEGYWLVPVWIIGFGISTGGGALAAGVARYHYHLGLLPMTLIASSTTLVISFLLARQAKAIFLAIDQFFDPPTKKNEGTPPE